MGSHEDFRDRAGSRQEIRNLIAKRTDFGGQLRTDW